MEGNEPFARKQTKAKAKIMAHIRPFEDRDWNDVWRILEPVFRAGETYPFAPDISRDDAFDVWIAKPARTYVVVGDENSVLGTYFIKPNQPHFGSHVCNCGYAVAQNAQGKGVASMMCLHSQQEALAQGYRAMQFNFVVATNTRAVRLGKRWDLT